VQNQHSVNIIEELKARKSYTPDLINLKKYDNHLIFIYCDLKHGLRNDKILKDAKCLGGGKTQSQNFNLKETTYPIAFTCDLPNTYHKGHIKGEVYAVDTNTIMKLDVFKNNGVHHNRIKKQILLSDQSYNTHTKICRPYAMCYMYIANDEYWNGRNLIQSKISNYSYPLDLTKKDQKVFEYLGASKSVIWGEAWGDGWPDNENRYPLSDLLH
jgi:gamma-glutamylcyclotransferase (GGCT)/AIG2-like uncharacterized protein YtfP